MIVLGYYFSFKFHNVSLQCFYLRCQLPLAVPLVLQLPHQLIDELLELQLHGFVEPQGR